MTQVDLFQVIGSVGGLMILFGVTDDNRSLLGIGLGWIVISLFYFLAILAKRGL